MHGMHTVYFIKDLSDPPRRLALFRAPLIHGFGAGAEGRWDQPPGAARPLAERFPQQAVVPLCHLPSRLPKQHPRGWGEQFGAVGLLEEQHRCVAGRGVQGGWQNEGMAINVQNDDCPSKQLAPSTAPSSYPLQTH